MSTMSVIFQILKRNSNFLHTSLQRGFLQEYDCDLEKNMRQHANNEIDSQPRHGNFS